MPVKNENLYVVLVKTDILTFSVLPPYVLSSQAVPVPSPLTLIGALMYPIKRFVENVISEEISIQDLVKEAYERWGVRYASFWVPLYIQARTLEKDIGLTYQRSDRASKLTEGNIAKCIGDIRRLINAGFQCKRTSKEKEKRSPDELLREELIKHGLNDVSIDCAKIYCEALQNMWGISSRSITFFATSSYLLYITSNKDISKYTWLITRIGRKEDVAIVYDVGVYELQKIIINTYDKCETRFYIPARLMKGRPENTTSWVLNNVINGNPAKEEFIIPIPIYSDKIQYHPDLDNAAIINLPINGSNECVAIPKEVIL
jgi:CRISPR/Cas system-associated protein Cas5 (RAMP superfamily)